MTDIIVVEATGFVSGVWVLWNSQKVTVEEISASNQILNLIVKLEDQEVWLAFVVYASPDYRCRYELWQYLKRLGTTIDRPWVLIGDFNQDSSPDEKQGGRPPNTQGMQQLQAVVDHCHLIDLWYHSPKYT